MKNLLLILLILIMASCQNNRENRRNSPLSVIMKLNSAEEVGDFDSAKQYQFIDSIYKEAAYKDSTTPENYWRGWVSFNNNLGKDKKFTNQLKYFNYDIEENVSNNNAQVLLIAKDKKSLIQSIIYDLGFDDKVWKVTKISYKKR